LSVPAIAPISTAPRGLSASTAKRRSRAVKTSGGSTKPMSQRV
jgi:hypothetical protein